MATDIVQGSGNGLVIQVTAGAAYSSGDAIMVGDQGLVGICLEDIASSATGSVMVPGGVVVDYPCKGHDGSSNTAIAVGDIVHFATGDAFFDVTAANKSVGYALEAVSSGSTTTINVLMCHSAGDLRS